MEEELIKFDLQMFAEEGDGDPGEGDTDGEKGGEEEKGEKKGSEEKEEKGDRGKVFDQASLKYRNNPAFKGMMTLDAILDSNLELQEQVKTAKELQMLPENADVYELKVPDLPKGMEEDKETVNWFRGLAFKAKLNPAQAKAIFEAYNTRQIDFFKDLVKSDDEAVKKITEDLKKKHGADYPKKEKAAKDAIEALCSDDFKTLLDGIRVNGKQLGTHPVVVDHFISLGEKMGEDEFIGGEKKGKSKEVTADGQLTYDHSPELHERKG